MDADLDFVYHLVAVHQFGIPGKAASIRQPTIGGSSFEDAESLRDWIPGSLKYNQVPRKGKEKAPSSNARVQRRRLHDTSADEVNLDDRVSTFASPSWLEIW